ncbi:MAG TPA: hypothetical protein VHD55_02825 [Candidatus Paceibacterota bacterium]|nr:hypothetical protein [Candidatus Paceibacterota bacterium]
MTISESRNNGLEGSSMFHVSAARAAAGATLLDQLMPGWAGHIDTGELDIQYDQSCVLGQLVGSYNGAPADLKKAPISNGFFSEAQAKGIDGTPVDDEYAELTAAWKPEIEKRRTPVAA